MDFGPILIIAVVVVGGYFLYTRVIKPRLDRRNTGY